ncbi:MAG TPA: beta-galactosidase [Puia sp.]|nr:beta-galactosidase [Puia sp.]
MLAISGVTVAQPWPALDRLRYGAAYYYEYMPQERLARDVQLMKAAGINTVRIAESTWGVWEPRDGVFDFTKLDKVLDAMEGAGIGVIIGTPTYAIPTWLAKEHPEVLVVTSGGRRTYGARQNMDIVSPVFRLYAERIIRRLVLHVRNRRCVIGYQADNETKSYGNMGPTMQRMFVESMRRRWGSTAGGGAGGGGAGGGGAAGGRAGSGLAAMNRAYGLNYWSNSINDWSAFPSMVGNVNASLGGAYAAFQRQMVTEYLAWQAGIIRALKRPDQFITQNFDLEWRESSYGIQPDVDHFEAAKAFDIAGIDIYHATADRLTGSEIAFGGDEARSMKRGNYLVMETQAQSLAGRQELPYPGQLRLQAYSHLASGADMVEYWPWMSLPNAVETYWKGVLSHDGEPNPVYEEVKQVGQEWRRIGDRLIHLKVRNKVAVFFSNASLTALGWYPFSDSLGYNDLLRREYDALYDMNIGCDLVNETSANLSSYSLIVVPPLYCVSDSVLEVLNAYVRRGGHILYSCKSGFTDENVQVRSAVMPGPLREAVGASYQLFTNIGHVPLAGDPMGVGSAANEVHDWAEMLVPEGATVVGRYDHPVWGKYAAITHHGYGKGAVWYLGTIPSAAVLRRVIGLAVKEAGVETELGFPLIVRGGVNKYGRPVRYYFNYSGSEKGFVYRHGGAVELLTGKRVEDGDSLTLPAWGVMIMEQGGGDGGRGGGGASEGARDGSGTSEGAGDGSGASEWLDTDGHFINAHGAGVMKHDGVYYLYGEIKKGKTRLVPGQNWEDYRVDAGGVSCYSSRDLVHWKNEGVVLAPSSTDTASDLYIGRVIERPKVIYNAVTRKYVMWMHIDRDDYGYARAGVAVSEQPWGPFRYLGSVRPNGQQSRDMTVYQDDDGRAYLVYASENNNTMQVCLLAPDYLSPTTVYRRILVDQRREAPAVFKADGKYYLITSLCSGWDPNAARIAVADSMLGNWVMDGNPCAGSDSATTFHSQSTFVLPLGGDRFLFMADRWNKTDLERSGYLWLPFMVRHGKVEISGPDPGVNVRSQRVEVGQLALVNYSVKVMGAGSSFIRFYDSADRLLLEYRVPVSDTGKWVETGNYVETPVGTKYAVIGVEGALEAKDWKIEPNIGETSGRHAPECNLQEYLKPFWKSDTIYNETVLMYSAGGGIPEGRLLFEPDRVLSVRSFGLDTVYRPGVDYQVSGRRLVRLAGSRMPFRADSSFDRSKDLAWYDLQSQWVVVTYTHHDRWAGPVPAYKGERLPRVLGRLRSGKPVTIVAYGMSITRGFDVSGYDGVRPYMPTYMDLFDSGLLRRFPQAAVEVYNAGLPGSTVDWGAKYVSSYVTPLRPDLVIIDFGMNDFWRMKPAEFGDSVRSIIRQVRAVQPEAEFVLLANMKFDPDYVLVSDKNKLFYTGNIAGYRDMLAGMEGAGIVMTDMTTLSDAVYKRKKARDCTVNPLHPNDYLARWYAQAMLATVIKIR